MNSTSGEPAESEEESARNGITAALLAYLMWGVLPVYFKFVQSVPSLEVLAHRILWAVPFGALIILWRRQLPEVKRALAHRRTLLYLVLSAGVISVNWYIYIIAVHQDQVFQASLGYYMNPLMYVLVGVMFFGERLRLLQSAAIGLAAMGVAVLTFSGGQFPSIAISLAVLFTIYGIIRKQAVVGGMPGLFIETVMILPFATIYLGWLFVSGVSVLGSGDVPMSLLLVLAGPFTVLPLLMFALAARRLQLTTIGIMQFMAPTMQFFIGMYYGEELTTAHLVCFACIWVAIAMFIADAWRQSRRIQALRAAGAP